MRRESRVSGLRRAVTLPRTARSVGRDVDEEIRFHIETHVAELIASGVSPAEAQARALDRFGDVGESRRELSRVDRARLARERWATWLDVTRQELGFALRVFRTRPGFSFATVLVLALGVGANATMFGVIDRLLLRPPAHVAHPERVMTVHYLAYFRGEMNSQDVLAYPQYLDLRATTGAFDDVAAYVPDHFAVGRGAEARRVSGSKVSANFFRTLGVQPRLGRFFLPEDDAAPAPNVAVVSSAFWEAQLAGDPAVLGHALHIGDAAFTIVGVAPVGFTGASSDAVDVWIPLTAGVSASELADWSQSRNSFFLLAVARVATGVSRETAADAATRTLRANSRRDGMSDEKLAAQRPGFELTSVLPREARAGDVGARVAELLGAVSFLVLLIACANVANLQLARGIARRREIAIRLALGVSRGRLLAQLISESLVLAMAGGASALFVAYWGSGFVRRVLFGSSNLAGAAVLDARTLAYTLVASVAVGIVSGAFPALAAGRASVTTELKDGARGAGPGRSRARSVLLLVQTMLSVILLVGTGLFVRSLRRVDALPIGLDPSHALVATVQTDGMHYSDADVTALYQRLLETAQASPGVEAAALATSLPFYTSWGVRVRVPGRDSLPRVRDGGPYMNEVTPGYFATMQTRILQGRGITSADQATAPRVVVVNESLARLWWPGENAIGKCMQIGGDTMPCSEIVGITENSRRQALVEDASLQYFIPLAQGVRTRGATPTLLIRPRGSVSAAIEPIRRALQTAAPNLPYVGIRPLEELVAPQKRSWRLGATMFAVFGGLALLLAGVGLYSVLAYDVAQRTREFGVRVALGARGADVMRMVLGRGLRTAIAGGIAGGVIALASGHWVGPLLFHTSPRDPEIYALVLGVVTAVALLAALLPAWRALRVDPIVALRAE